MLRESGLRYASSPEQDVESPGALERHQLVAATDRCLIDKDLRECRAPTGSLGHRAPCRMVAIDDVLPERHTFPLQKCLGPDAVGAVAPGVEFDVRQRFDYEARLSVGSALRWAPPGRCTTWAALPSRLGRRLPLTHQRIERCLGLFTAAERLVSLKRALEIVFCKHRVTELEIRHAEVIAQQV